MVASPEINEVIRQSRIRIEMAVDFASRDFEKALNQGLQCSGSSSAFISKKLTTRLHHAKRSLDMFNSITTGLSQYFNLSVLVIDPLPLPEKRKLRKRFDHDRKASALIRAAQTHPREFLSMGIKKDELALLEAGMIPAREECPLDISVDHIKDIGLGGTNDIENLCIVPDHVNALRARFHTIQYPDPDTRHIVTLMPIFEDFRAPEVPFFPDGFRIKSGEAGVINQRIKSLINISLGQS